jgi:flagellar motor switch/type III secretory pathway protein FliN
MEDTITNNTEGTLLRPENLDVQIKCEVGKINISISQLLALKIGDTLTIDKWPQTVKLIANGTFIAEGFLTEVNGMLAVKISKGVTPLENYKENQ